MKLLREKIWWYGIDIDVETFIQNCHACQLMCNQSCPPPVNMSKLPDGSWKSQWTYASGDYLLVLIDYYSRFSEVEVVRSITSANIINKLRKIFAVHGLCSETSVEI